MATVAVYMPAMLSDDKTEVVATDNSIGQLCCKLRRAAANGHLLGLWETLTLLNQRNDEMDAHAKLIDATDENGETALTLAAINGHARVVQVRAAAAGHCDCVAVLRHRSPESAMCSLDACYEEGDLKGHNALSIAALHGHSSVVRELLEEDPIADVHSGPYHGAALLEAARRGHGQVVDILLQHGCDPDCHSSTGRTPAICEAAGHMCWPVCALLVAYGADVADMRDPVALLEVSAFSVFLELDDAVAALLQQCNSLCIDLNQPLAQGCTLLTAAVACGNVPGLQLLLAHGVSPSVKDSVGNTPLSIAAALGLCDAVKALLSSGADPDACAGEQQEFPLQIALHLWYASAQQAQLRHAASFDEALDSGGGAGMPVMADVVGNAVARNALELMEQECAESVELGGQGLNGKPLGRSEVLEALARDVEHEEKMEQRREQMAGMGGRGPDGEGVRGMGADVVSRLRRAAEGFWGTSSGSLAGTDDDSAHCSDDSGSDASFHDSSAALPAGHPDPRTPFLAEGNPAAVQLDASCEGGLLQSPEAEGKPRGVGVMAAAVEASPCTAAAEKKASPRMPKPSSNGVIASGADEAAAAAAGGERGDEYLPQCGTGADAALRSMDCQDMFQGTLSSLSGLSNISAERAFQGACRHIFCATNMPDEVRFAANSASLNTVSALDAAALPASTAAGKRGRIERARAALETPLSAASSGFLVPLSSPYRPLRPLPAQFRPLAPGAPSSLDLWDAEASSNSLSGWNRSSFTADDRPPPPSSQFSGARALQSSRALFKRGRQPRPPSTASRSEKAAGGTKRLPRTAGATPWPWSKSHRSLPGYPDAAGGHQRSRLCLGRPQPAAGSPPALGAARASHALQTGGDDDSFDSPKAACMHWPQSLSRSMHSSSGTNSMHVGQRQAAVAIDSSSQPRPCCTPSVAALWAYVTLCWAAEDRTEGLRSGTEGRPRQSPASSLDSTSIAAGAAVAKGPRLKGSPLQPPPPSSTHSGSSMAHPPPAIPLANEAFDNPQMDSSFGAPMTQTPLVTMHAAVKEIEISPGSSEGTVNSALAAKGRSPRTRAQPLPAAAASSDTPASTEGPRSVDTVHSTEYGTPLGEHGRQGPFGGAATAPSPGDRVKSEGGNDMASPTFATPDSSAHSFRIDGAAQAAEPECPGLAVFGNPHSPSGSGAAAGAAVAAEGGAQPAGRPAAAAHEGAELSTEFALLAQSMAAEGASWSDATAGVGIDGLCSSTVPRRPSAEASEVSLSLQCPPMFVEEGGAVAVAGGQLANLSLADRWSFEELPKVHGDVEDSGTLEPDSHSSVAGAAASAQHVHGGSREAPSGHYSNGTRERSHAAESILVAPAQSDAVKRTPNRCRKMLNFRMDGDLGLMSCVRVLFSASKEARTLISHDMMLLLLEHGVLQQQEASMKLMRT